LTGHGESDACSKHVPPVKAPREKNEQNCHGCKAGHFYRGYEPGLFLREPHALNQALNEPGLDDEDLTSHHPHIDARGNGSDRGRIKGCILSVHCRFTPLGFIFVF
jgi:hypothetical protein